MAFDIGEAVFHTTFGYGQIKAITPHDDPGYALDAHHIEFNRGDYRTIIGNRHLLHADSRELKYVSFHTGDVVHHCRFGYGVIEATWTDDEIPGGYQCDIVFDEPMGRHTVAGAGALRHADGLGNARRNRRRPPPDDPDDEPSPAQRRAQAANRHGVPAHVQAMRNSAYFDLYRDWLYNWVYGHNDDPLFARLALADSPAVWRFIERRYLRRYRVWLWVVSGPCSSGLARIQYPGSGIVPAKECDPSDYGAPAWLDEALYRWSQDTENAEFGCAHEHSTRPDLEALNARGLALAKQLRTFVGSECYIEFRRFQEIALVDGVPVELSIPSAIARWSAVG